MKRQQYRKLAEARDKASSKIALLIGIWKLRCARYLDQKINALSAVKKRWLLVGFCCLLSFYCLWLLIKPFTGVQKNSAVRVAPIQLPKKQPIEKPSHPVFIPEEQYKRIHTFKWYLDSLAGDTIGHSIYDSMLEQHPGLMDSLQQIEDYYQLQK